ncbi:hypothetical protein OCOJLMKI_0749 [Methylobacterium iners]|uniref:Uncharacterized protein n=1 Tax=Methylobacterium iners TaxID=418707 RepID=A0ABQ4RV26_9HYPH|nr:hypothetical protein OCOJLMKI_0749 [Methylobacterium iners]
MSLFTSLNVRLPAATVGLALLSAAAMGGLSWYAARAGLTEAAQERLQSPPRPARRGSSWWPTVPRAT